MSSLDRDFIERCRDYENTRQKNKLLRARSAELVQKLRGNCEDIQKICKGKQRSCCVARGSRTQEAPSFYTDPTLALRATLGELDLDGATDALIATYEIAVARGDDAMELELRSLLFTLGRYLAARVEPKDAGIVLS